MKNLTVKCWAFNAQAPIHHRARWVAIKDRAGFATASQALVAMMDFTEARINEFIPFCESRRENYAELSGKKRGRPRKKAAAKA